MIEEAAHLYGDRRESGNYSSNQAPCEFLSGLIHPWGPVTILILIVLPAREPLYIQTVPYS
jgi:hypothetical protein